MDATETQTRRARTRGDPEVRRAQILEEAVRIIGERGYFGFAVQELAERCGLTCAGLLYHFKTKETLLFAVLDELDRRGEAMLVAMRADFAAKGDSRESVLKLLRTMVVRSTAHPEQMRLHAVSQAESVNRDHPGYNHFRQRQARFMDALAGMFAGVTDQPHATARQISATMLGLQLQWLREGAAFDLVAEWDMAAAKLLPARKRVRAPSVVKSRGRKGARHGKRVPKS